MPKNVGYKPNARRGGSSPLTEPRPPKPRTQGDAKSSGPGSGALKPSIRGGNSMAKPARGRLATRPTKGPGSGTRGSGRSHNSVKRT
jgi:hypothetical protein